ncbi:MAG: hypothetical protein MJ212_05950, partial [Alphaproteobacteria bacterium]|nr:hypothetical protein [Alphaproteobacteria bacterium]
LYGFASRFNKALENKGITKKQLAHEIGCGRKAPITRAAGDNITNALNNMSDEELNKLMKYITRITGRRIIFGELTVKQTLKRMKDITSQEKTLCNKMKNKNSVKQD